MLVSRTVTGRHVEGGLGRDVGPSAVVSHVDGRAYTALIEIAFEAARDPPLQCDCFGLLMRQGYILKGQVVTHIRVEHLCDNKVRFVLNDFRNFKHKGIGLHCIQCKLAVTFITS